MPLPDDPGLMDPLYVPHSRLGRAWRRFRDVVLWSWLNLDRGDGA